MTTTPPLPYWKVMKAMANGGKIAGKRRALHAVFQAPEKLVRFQVLEGILAACDSAGIVAGNSGGSGSGSSGGSGG